MHYETVALFVVLAGNHAAEPGALPRERLALQVQWSPKCFSVPLCLTMPAFFALYSLNTPTSCMPYALHLPVLISQLRGRDHGRLMTPSKPPGLT